jgi:alkylation response protein AidB-like acyl-CoA dehydrogenase
MPTSSPTEESAGLVEAARALAPRIRACREEIERDRRLPAEIVAGMHAARLLHMLVPREAGGLEVDLATACRAIEEIARADGSAGWNLMIGVEQGVFAAYLPRHAACTVWGENANAVTAGGGAPVGRATVVPGGYRVQGRWRFASGCNHCTWLGANALLFDGDAQRRDAGGAAITRWMLFPVARARILDTWYTAGMRGTGSHDFVVDDLFVPEAFSFSTALDRPWPGTPLYTIPYPSIVAITMAAVALGIARSAIEALVALAATKTPTGALSPLRERPAVQAVVAQAEALLRSSRALHYQTVDEVWQNLPPPASLISVEQRAALRLAAVNAAVCCARAVDLMYEGGGGSSIYETSPLARCFRDVHTLTQHFQITPPHFETLGRIFLGMEPGTAFF